MEKTQEKNTTLIAVIVIVVAVTAGVIGWILAKNSQAPTQSVATQSAPATQTQPTVNQQTQNIPAQPSITNQQISFDGCGKIEKYKTETWYQDVIKKLQNNNQSLGGVWEVCQSLDKSLVILLTNGGSSERLNEYCDAGSIFKYDIGTKNLVKAVFDDKGRGCVSWPSEFGKRSDNIIPLQGSGGDAGCGNTMYYSYNFIDNKIQLVKECGRCEGDKQENCQNF